MTVMTNTSTSPPANSIIRRLLNRRIRVQNDRHPGYDVLYCNRYRWMQLNDLKVSPRVLKSINEVRKLPADFSISHDKRLAVIVPFRNREHHLQHLLPRLTEKLNADGIDYQIFVIEQSDNKLFNRAKLLNTGVNMAGNSFDYFCFHDVDMLPVDCDYGFPSSPLRLFSSLQTTDRLRKLSNVYFGGIVTIARDQFMQANGFGNEFWHWGKEDDNFLLRLLLCGIPPAIDAQGIFKELDDSTNRHTVPNTEPATDQIALSKQYIKENRRQQRMVATGRADPFADGYSTLKYKVEEQISYPDHEFVKVAL